MPYKNTDKNREYQKNWARKNQSKMLAKRNIRRKKYMLKAIEMKGGLCTECGTTEELQFHHPDPSNKVASVSRLIRDKGWATIEKEVNKCVLVCKGCHERIHVIK